MKQTSKEQLHLSIYYKDNPFVEKYELEKHLRQLEKSLRKTIEVEFILSNDFEFTNS